MSIFGNYNLHGCQLGISSHSKNTIFMKVEYIQRNVYIVMILFILFEKEICHLNNKT